MHSQEYNWERRIYKMTIEKEEIIEEEVEQETQPAAEKEEEPKFTQSQLDEIIQKRLDRAMTKAEEERKQAEELAKLSAKERAAKELELKEQELEEERKEFYRERLELQTTKELDRLNLPISFTEYVIGDDAESTQERIKAFHELWEEEHEKRRLDSMKGKTPSVGKLDKITKDSILSIGDPIERKRKIAENIELFN